MNLPTGDCAGDSSKPNCFFANVVTDVAVQPADKFGHKGGAVIAAVGWRAGQFPNFNGKPQAPANGLYRSDNGTPGSFTKVPDSAGFTPTDHAGRTEFGTTTGPTRTRATCTRSRRTRPLFVEQSGGENDIPLVGTPSVLDAIYVSPDFGKTWTVMESRNEFFNPANGSALSQLTALGIGPATRSPTTSGSSRTRPAPPRTASPARVMLGMEEVWQTNSTQLVPQDGHSQFQVIGAYTANGGACLVVPEQCGTKQAVAGNTTTHPDQHAGLLIPDGSGGVTLLAGNDGGAYKQHADPSQEFDQTRWGTGANNGFHTLLPYGAAMAKDGTVYAGLQDNGQLKILPNGEQHTVYVGDGIFALVDPDNSQIAYDELPNAGINVSTDGGTTWSSIDPSLDDPDFVAPMVMDPKDAKHILTGGRDIAETTAGPDTTTCKTDPNDPTSCQPPQTDTDWKYVFNLGTHNHPGDPTRRRRRPRDADGRTSRGAQPRVGRRAERRQRVRRLLRRLRPGEAPPRVQQRVRDERGRRQAAEDRHRRRLAHHRGEGPAEPDHHRRGARPERPEDRVRDARRQRRALLRAARLAGRGRLERRRRARVQVDRRRRDVQDISGNLPNVQATWPLVRNGQLIVATAIGVFASQGTNGGKYSPLGNNLPSVAVYQISLKPGDPDTLVAATFGRGVYTYKFADPKPGAGCVDKTAPKTRIAEGVARAALRAHGRRKLRFRGTVTDRTSCKGKKGKVKRVVISIARQIGRTGRGGRPCRNLKANGRFAKAAAATSSSTSRRATRARSGASRRSAGADRLLPDPREVLRRGGQPGAARARRRTR